MATDTQLFQTLLIIVAAILLLPFLMMLFLFPIVGMGHMWYWNGTGGALWPWLLVGFVCLIVIFGIVYLLSQAITGLRRPNRDTEREELRRAYARGDLSDEEFEKRRERLLDE